MNVPTYEEMIEKMSLARVLSIAAWARPVDEKPTEPPSTRDVSYQMTLPVPAERQ